MRICDLQSPLGRLQRETKTLQERWAETKVHWRDQACRDFEATYLEPLLPDLKLALAAIHEFSDVLAQAEKACDDQQSS